MGTDGAEPLERVVWEESAGLDILSRVHSPSRCASPQASLPVSMMWALEASRSTTALHRRGSGKTFVHSPKGRFVVVMVDDSSERSSSTWKSSSKSSSASAGESARASLRARPARQGVARAWLNQARASRWRGVASPLLRQLLHRAVRDHLRQGGRTLPRCPRALRLRKPRVLSPGQGVQFPLQRQAGILHCRRRVAGWP